MSNAAKVMSWNGTDLPPELAGLPPGQYAIEPVDGVESVGLSAEQIEGLRAGTRSLDEGHGTPWAAVEARLRDKLARRGE